MSKHSARKDFPGSQGGAAIGARLRRLSERLDREAGGVYAALGVRFEQRWFGLLNQLKMNGPMSVGDIAAALGVTHVAVSQTRAALLRNKLVVVGTDPADARRNVLRLSAAGQRLADQLSGTWQLLNVVGLELDREAGGFVAAVERLEHALDRRGVVERVERLRIAKER